MEHRKSFLLRMDPGLWSDLEDWAADELRSVNGQIEYLLRQAVQRRKGTSAAPPPPAAGTSAAPPAAPPETETTTTGLSLETQD
jgi:hypothetical protein